MIPHFCLICFGKYFDSIVLLGKLIVKRVVNSDSVKFVLGIGGL